MTLIKGIVVLLLAAVACPAAAETVFKYQRPDGKVIYSDSPVAGAKLIGRFELVPAPARADRNDPPAPPSPVAAGVERRLQAIDAADARVKAAARGLQQAEERQQQAVEPLPGERRGNVNGHSRLTPTYFARQRTAAAAVDAARDELEDAYAERNDVRE